MPATAGEPHPYKTCIVLGHVTDKTGKKESKSIEVRPNGVVTIRLGL